MRARSAPLALLVVFGLTGACSKHEEPPAHDTAQDTARGDAAALLQGARLVAPGRLTVCSDIPYAPFEFSAPNPAGGESLTGFDVELVRALAAQLALAAEFRTTPFDGIIAALAAGDCDLIASAVTVTPERRQKVAFTQSYFDADQSLLIRASDRDRYRQLGDLAARTIGVQSGTTGEIYAKGHLPAGATVKDFPGAEDLFSALVAGDIDAVLQDFPVNKYRALKAPAQFAVTETFRTGEQYGFAVARDNPKLVAALDTALGNLRRSGAYGKIHRAWFGE